mgnify:CR=1 FL=1
MYRRLFLSRFLSPQCFLVPQKDESNRALHLLITAPAVIAVHEWLRLDELSTISSLQYWPIEQTIWLSLLLFLRHRIHLLVRRLLHHFVRWVVIFVPTRNRHCPLAPDSLPKPLRVVLATT